MVRSLGVGGVRPRTRKDVGDRESLTFRVQQRQIRVCVSKGTRDSVVARPRIYGPRG